MTRPWREAPDWSKKDKIIITTCNIGSCSDHSIFTTLLQTAAAHHWDIICLQEHCIPKNQRSHFERTARNTGGWSIAWGHEDRTVDATRTVRGVLILSRWPCAPIRLDEHQDLKRTVAVSVHRPRAPPFTLVSYYGLVSNPTGSPQAKNDHIRNLFQRLAGNSHDTIVLGDWNTTPDSPPILETVATGIWELLDSRFPDVTNT